MARGLVADTKAICRSLIFAGGGDDRLLKGHTLEASNKR